MPQQQQQQQQLPRASANTAATASSASAPPSQWERWLSAAGRNTENEDEEDRDAGAGSRHETAAHWDSPAGRHRLLQSEHGKQFHDDPFWYSFNAGPVHFIMANTELPLFKPTPTDPCPQWVWLLADLKAVDRALTPVRAGAAAAAQQCEKC
jgi:hypothetical protein